MKYYNKVSYYNIRQKKNHDLGNFYLAMSGCRYWGYLWQHILICYCKRPLISHHHVSSLIIIDQMITSGLIDYLLFKTCPWQANSLLHFMKLYPSNHVIIEANNFMRHPSLMNANEYKCINLPKVKILCCFMYLTIHAWWKQIINRWVGAKKT